MAARDPWLSIVIPAWNGEQYLAEALESIRQEGTAGYEVVAVDDGSSDRTPDILRSWEALLPLRRIAHERSGNWVAATNAGLRAARGDYVCFLHQDDLWLRGRLAALQREVASSPALVVHPAVFIGPDGRRLGRWRCPLPAGAVDTRMFAERLLVQNFIAIPAAAFQRELALRTGGMDESLWYTADWDLWLRLGRAGAVRHFTSTLAAFRVHPASQTVVRDDLVDRRRQLETVVERHGATARPAVARAARLSVELNLALAARAKGAAVEWGPLLGTLSRAGPLGCARYLRDSRILERVRARLRVGAHNLVASAAA
jgi:glycosyltransferase involved in cell wall biosynthesis